MKPRIYMCSLTVIWHFVIILIQLLLVDISEQCKFGVVLCKDASILFKAFTTFVRPMLDYCSPVWSPILFAYEPTRWFTKRVLGLQSPPYDERCNLLGIDRVVLRRLRADLILCYKVIRDWFCTLVAGFALIYNSITTHGYSF